MQKENKTANADSSWSVVSMTGAGRARCCQEKFNIDVAVKSVNHRGLDIKIRVPLELLGSESEIHSAISKQFARGRIDVFVTIERNESATGSIAFNAERAATFLETLHQFCAEHAVLVEPIEMKDVLALPGVVSENSSAIDATVLSPIVVRTVSEALLDLKQMCEQEGRALAQCLHKIWHNCKEHVEWIASRTSQDISTRFSILKDRCDELFASYGLRDERIYQECALLAERSDFKEEIDRLQAHIQHFTFMCAQSGTKGRKLDFLCQEMLREINTLLSKAFDQAISVKAIELKAEIERMREQVQNIV